MCVVSAVGDYWKHGFPDRYPKIHDTITSTSTGIDLVSRIEHTILQTEVKALRQELEALKSLLKAAKVYDDATDQHECENEDKIALIKKLADLVGVDLKDVI